MLGHRDLRPMAASLVAAAIVASGCSTLLAVREQQQLAAELAVVGGRVGADHETKGPIIVAIVGRGEHEYFVVDHFVTEQPGPFVFAVAAGRYWLAALEDANRDGRYDGEPALRPEPENFIDLAPGQRIDDVVLTIPRDGRLRRDSFSFSDLFARRPEEQPAVSVFALSVAGRVVSLDDARFDQRVADAGMWKFYDFFLSSQPGIYFLHEYDRDKIPVIFVHGMRGSPRTFRSLVDSLDRTRYQPWLFYYPSGANLDTLAGLFAQLFLRLQLEYGFDRFAVVAHSMGGLVSRAFLLDYYAGVRQDIESVFVTISSPLGGMPSAGAGVERSPVVINSWRGLAPGSEFLEGLFYSDPTTKAVRRRLPRRVSYHMLFGFRGGNLSGSSDGIVPLASQLRAEAQQEALSLRGFDEDHTSILLSDAAARRLNEILATMQ
jgi:pimeloyl-ACP methyl ester carboxylesterase